MKIRYKNHVFIIFGYYNSEKVIERARKIAEEYRSKQPNPTSEK